VVAVVALGAALATGTGRAVAVGDPPVRLVVAPDGSGTACGDAAPCAITDVQAQVRDVNSSQDVEVVLTDGTYPLAAPLRFGAADGGRNGHHVAYVNAPGAHPTISGGIAVTQWTRSDTNATWSAPVPIGTVSRELYVDGHRAPRTSVANPAWLQTATGYLTADLSVLAWHNPSNVELVFNEGNGFWTEPRCDVASVAPALGGLAAAVTVREPCWSNLHIPATPAQPTAMKNDNAMGGFQGLTRISPPSALENVFMPLAEGQWYLDAPAGRVLYRPAAGVDPNRQSIVLPRLESLVVGTGTLDDPVRDLTFRGLTFAHTTWRQPSGDDGFVEMQANTTLTGRGASGTVKGPGLRPQGTCQYTTPRGSCPFAAWTMPPAAVTFRAAHAVTLERDTLTHLGAAGIRFAFGSKDNVIRGNEITDTSGSGILLGGTDDQLPSFVGADGREILERNQIVDNWVHDIAAEYHGGIGIWVGYTRDTLIAHNEIDRTPYTAISMGWGGWHTDTLNADNPNVNARNVIANNLIADYLMTLPDGGAIYTNGQQGPIDPAGPAAFPFLTGPASATQMARGLTLRGNVALLATWSEFAYYNDEGSDYVTYDHNVEYQAHALAHGGCSTVGHIVIEHNYWAQPIAGYICPPPPVDIRIIDHHVINDHPGPSAIPTAILAAAGLEPAYRDLVTAHVPDVTGVGPGGPGFAAGLTTPLLISGTGFTPGMQVFFGSPSAATASRDVHVLSANYAIAAPPPGAAPGQVDVVVRTPSGTSAPTARDQYLFL